LPVGSRHLRDFDPTLLSSLRTGADAEAERSFEALIRAYYSELLRYAMRAVGSSVAAEDVLQDLFLRIWASRHSLEIRESVRAYLYTALRRQIYDHAKIQRRHGRREGALAREWRAGDAGGSPSWTTDALQDIEQADLASAVREAIGQLPERCREVYVLSREHGLSYGEIAETLGISVNTVKTQMGRAIRVLRRVAAPFLVAVLALRS